MLEKAKMVIKANPDVDQSRQKTRRTLKLNIRKQQYVHSMNHSNLSSQINEWSTAG